MQRCPTHRNAPRQDGVVLITGLIFMVVLTIVVLAIMRSSSLEERMASNARNRQLALHAAEAVARDAEATLFSGAAINPIEPFDSAGFSDTCAGGFCALGTGDWKSDSLWSDSTKTRTFAAGGDFTLAGITSRPRYIVEPISAEGGQPGKICPKIVFRITARGLGRDSSAAFVETMYRYRPDKFKDGSCG